jgi:hypothetical protein
MKSETSLRVRRALTGPDLQLMGPQGDQNVEAPVSNNKFYVTAIRFHFFIITKITNQLFVIFLGMRMSR